jgi:UDP-2,4-diacetamido-2,4,6-trideoxy-beta-L-altropyranose hydrolase
MTDLSPAFLNSTQRLAIRVDANPEIALGHLKRSLSLAEALGQAGLETVFVTNPNPEAMRQIGLHGFKQYVSESPIGSEADWNYTFSVMTKMRAEAILVDSYEVDASYLRCFQDHGCLVVCLDDIGDHELACDLVINGSLGAESIAYGPRCDARLLGAQYCVLDRNFWAPQIRQMGSIRNVLVTMGGIDHYNLTVHILRILDKRKERFTVTVIIGPFYENSDEITRQISGMKKQVFTKYRPDNLYEPMVACDLAFSAGGRTLYELATLGRPTIGIALWENQYLNVKELAQQGIIWGLQYRSGEAMLGELSDLTDRIFQDARARSEMRENGVRIFDGQGAVRVAAEIISLAKNRGKRSLGAFASKESSSIR